MRFLEHILPSGNTINSRQQNLILFYAIPIAINLLLMFFYFGGIDFLQQIIAPTISFLRVRSWREFGILEILQNIYLVSIFSIFFHAAITRQHKQEKIFFSFLSFLFLFLFLEEIDYGIHVYELFKGHYINLEFRNWHNQGHGKRDNAHFLKLAVDIITVFWFIILPLLSNKIKIPIIKCLLPSRYFVAGFILTFLFSKTAHFLEGHELSIINGVGGNLSGNISEFREQNTYYYYLLYAAQIAKSTLHFSFKQQPSESTQNRNGNVSL